MSLLITDAMHSRSAAFSTVEKKILIGLVGKFKGILENKRTDAATCEKKRAAWRDLSKEYNSYSNVTTRDEKQLKRCWEKMKTTFKKEKTEEVKPRTGTGGGPYRNQVEDPLAAERETIVPHIDEEISGSFDYDYHQLNIVPSPPSSYLPGSTASNHSSGNISPTRPFYLSVRTMPSSLPEVTPFGIEATPSTSATESIPSQKRGPEVNLRRDQEQPSSTKGSMPSRKRVKVLSAIMDEVLKARLSILEEEREIKKKINEGELNLLRKKEETADIEQQYMLTKLKLEEAKLAKFLQGHHIDL